MAATVAQLEHPQGRSAEEMPETDDTTYLLAMPADESVVDVVDTVAHVYEEPGVYAIDATTERSDGEIIAVSESITIGGIAPRLELLRDTANVAQGSACTLQVQVSGTGPFSFVWLKDDTALSADSMALIIDSVSQESEGTYRCCVHSPWGTDTSGALAVIVRPSGWIAAPTNFHLYSSDSALFVGWERVAGAERYRVFHGANALVESGEYVEVTEPYCWCEGVRAGEYVWVRAVRGNQLSAPSVPQLVSDSAQPSANAPPYWLPTDTLRLMLSEGEASRVALDSLCVDPDMTDSLVYSLIEPPPSAQLEPPSTLVLHAGNRSAGLFRFAIRVADASASDTLQALLEIAVVTCTLHVDSSDSGGSVTIDPSLQHYRWGDTVALTALPAHGYRFAGWDGDTTAADSHLVFALSYTCSLAAHFTNTNNSPDATTLLWPAAGQTEVDIDSLRFVWHDASDPDGDVVTYLLKYGTDLSMGQFVQTADTCYMPTPQLRGNRQYFWQVWVIAGRDVGGIPRQNASFPRIASCKSHPEQRPLLVQP